MTLIAPLALRHIVCQADRTHPVTSYPVVELLGDGISAELSSSVHTLVDALPFDLEFNQIDLGHESQLEHGEAILAEIIMKPERYGVIVCPNEYGYFLSDSACGLIGSDIAGQYLAKTAISAARYRPPNSRRKSPSGPLLRSNRPGVRTLCGTPQALVQVAIDEAAHVCCHAGQLGTAGHIELQAQVDHFALGHLARDSRRAFYQLIDAG